MIASPTIATLKGNPLGEEDPARGSNGTGDEDGDGETSDVGVGERVGVGETDEVATGVGVTLGIGLGVTNGEVDGDGEAIGVGVGVTIGVALGVVVGVGVATTAHEGTITTLPSSVTAPVRAMARPSSEAPVVSVIETEAKTDPFNCELAPSVADEPTSQNTLHA